MDDAAARQLLRARTATLLDTHLLRDVSAELRCESQDLCDSARALRAEADQVRRQGRERALRD